jgi:hypothetical protein
MKESYETHAKGIRILPGQWRPHYTFEHTAWISPSWPSQDYIWLDYPEAVKEATNREYDQTNVSQPSARLSRRDVVDAQRPA